MIKQYKNYCGQHGLLSLFLALFLAIQTLCSFHIHTPYHDHDHDHDHAPAQQVECDVCLVAGMPIDIAGVGSVGFAAPLEATTSPPPNHLTKPTLPISPDRARAPPHA
ncbi:MAG: hypothetical protein AB3N28_14295 [Kordiimonas sp.]